MKVEIFTWLDGRAAANCDSGNTLRHYRKGVRIRKDCGLVFPAIVSSSLRSIISYLGKRLLTLLAIPWSWVPKDDEFAGDHHLIYSKYINVSISLINKDI